MNASEAYRIQVAAFPDEADGELVAAGHDELVPADQHARHARGSGRVPATGGGRAGRARSPPCRSSGGRRAGPRRSRSADSTCQRRASQPSIWSVTAAAAKRIAAGQLWPPSAVARSTMNTGIAAKRAIVSAFGICARRSGTTRSAIPREDSWPRRLPSPAGRWGLQPPPRFERIERRRTRGTRDRAGRVTMHPRG